MDIDSGLINLEETVESLCALSGASKERCQQALQDSGGEFETALEILRSLEEQAPSAEHFDRLEDSCVDVDTLDGKVADLLVRGERFTDAEFMTTDWRILYQEEQRGWEWMCDSCHAKNQVAVEFRSVDAMRTELTRQEVRMVNCVQCAHDVPLRNVLVMRVWDFVRPEAVRDEITRMPVGRLDRWRLFRGAPEASDVHQGMVGNCWFLAAVAVVADRRPDLLTRLFWNAEISETGLYAVKLFVNGAWRWLLVDDLLPVNAIGHLAFSASLRFQLWMPLLEKAAAKVAGSFEALHGGSFAEAFALLTGQPTDEIPLVDQEEDLLWSRLVSWDAAGYLLGVCCVATKSGHSLAALNDLGLQAPHGYTIIKTVEYETERLVQLRNPIGERSQRVWQGPWSFASMSAKAKRDLQVVNVNGDFLLHPKADFLMPFSCFLKYFALLEVCRANDWPSVSQRVWLHHRGDTLNGFRIRRVANVENKPPLPCDLSLYQEVGKVRKIDAHVPLGFALIPDFLSSQADCGLIRRRGETSIESHLASGTSGLLVPLCLSAPAGENRKISLTVHVPPGTEEEIVVSHLSLTKAELARGIFVYLEKHGKAMATSVPGLTLWSVQVDGVGLILAVENAGLFPITVVVDALDSVGVHPSRGSLLTEDTVEPGTKAVLQIIIFAQSEAKIAYSTAVRLAVGQAAKFFPPIVDHVYHEFVRIKDPTQQLLAHYLKEGLDPTEAASVTMQEMLSQVTDA